MSRRQPATASSTASRWRSSARCSRAQSLWSYSTCAGKTLEPIVPRKENTPKTVQISLADRLALLYPYATKAKNPFNIKALADHCATYAGSFPAPTRGEVRDSRPGSRNRSRIRRGLPHVGRRPNGNEENPVHV